MPDTVGSAATTTPTIAPASPPPAPKPPEAPPERAATSVSETRTETSAPDWRTAIDSVDPKELLKHSKIAGILGDLAQRRAREERQKWDAELRTREEDARLRALRDHDPAQYVEEEKRLEQERAQVTQSQAAIYKDFDDSLSEMYFQLPKKDQEELAGKSFGDGFAGRRAALREFATRLARAEATTELSEASARDRAKWEKEREAAIRKELLAELNGKEPTPDTGGGTSAPGALTAEEFERNRGDATWRRANKDRINTLLASMPVPKRR